MTQPWTETELESELDGDIEHSINLCDEHLNCILIGSIMESSCGVLFRYIPHRDRCPRCVYGSSDGPLCVVCDR